MIQEQRIRELAASPIADEALLAAELLAARETIERLAKERDAARTELGAARAALQGIATVLAAAFGAEECPPVTDDNLHAVVDECLARVARMRTENGAQIAAGKALYEAAQKLMAENERLAKQRDEMVDERPWMDALADLVGRVLEGEGVETFTLTDLYEIFGRELVSRAMPMGGS